MPSVIDIYDRDNYRVIKISGVLDFPTATKFRERIKTEIKLGHLQIILDLSEVGLVDSGGVGVLVVSHRELSEQDGIFRVAGLRESVRKTLERSKIIEILNIYDSVDSAVSD